MVKKQIVIELDIEDGNEAERTADALFTAATDGVASPVGFGFAKYKVVHQKLNTLKK